MSKEAPIAQFNPMQDQRAYRSALGRFATGIAVVTTTGPDGPIAITVNSFASVSLDPALILWSPDKSSKRHDVFVKADHFVVHILAANQKHICDGFARAAYAFDEIDVQMSPEGSPVIQGCLAVFECRKSAAHDAGDHTILIGEVFRVSEQAGESLVYAHGAFAKLAVAG